MIFAAPSIEEVFLVELEELGDARAFFARALCKEEARIHGLETILSVEANISYSRYAGALCRFPVLIP